MALSQKKQLKMARANRVAEIDARSLNGKGYWMDANHEDWARRYIETGDQKWIDYLPDYRIYH